MNQSLRQGANPIGGAGFRHEALASWAFVERNFYIVRRYWGWEFAFLIFNVASSMSVLYIGEAQQQRGGGASAEGATQDLVLYLGIGTVVWAYLRAVFSNIGEMVAWERWEGTIEYTMMAPISRLTHMLGVSLFSILYGLARSALLLAVLALFFDVDLSGANLSGGTLILLAGSLSFIGFGIIAAVLPLLFPERGEEMTFVISSVLLLVSGVYYPVSVLPGWMEGMAAVSPATYVLEGMRATVLDGAATGATWEYVWPTLLIGAVSLPLGVGVFGWAERFAKRTGRLKRSG
ncbi:MAG: ABC transporter permease [Chloroflexota bacterium]|nr:ABC transporter permease [Chloroflexota bacterium]